MEFSHWLLPFCTVGRVQGFTLYTVVYCTVSSKVLALTGVSLEQLQPVYCALGEYFVFR